MLKDNQFLKVRATDNGVRFELVEGAKHWALTVPLFKLRNGRKMPLQLQILIEFLQVNIKG